jgi:hypothetical protein
MPATLSKPIEIISHQLSACQRIFYEQEILRNENEKLKLDIELLKKDVELKEFAMKVHNFAYGTEFDDPDIVDSFDFDELLGKLEEDEAFFKDRIRSTHDRLREMSVTLTTALKQVEELQNKLQ